MGVLLPHGKGNFREGAPVVKYRDTLRSPVRKWLNRLSCFFDCDLGMAQGIMNEMGVQIPHGKGQFWGKGSPIIKYRDFLPWAVQKWLYRLICRLGCGLGLAEGSTSSVVFARWRHCAHMGGHIGDTWRIRLNCLYAAAMRSYVRLFWPLVSIMCDELSEWCAVFQECWSADMVWHGRQVVWDSARAVSLVMRSNHVDLSALSWWLIDWSLIIWCGW